MQNWGRQKKKNIKLVRKIRACLEVELVLKEFLCLCPCDKSRSKIALFSNERHFEIWFPQNKAITFFKRKLSKLHEKDTIFHVTFTFPLKQGETRTSRGPICVPLTENRLSIKWMWCAVDNHNHFVPHMRKRTFRFELYLSGYLQNVNFSRNYPKFYMLTKIAMLKVWLEKNRPTASTI